jgi:uncharacterized OB-fold protein
MSETANGTTDVVREPPAPRSFSRAYWEGTRQKKLLVQFDRRSGKYQFFPRPNSLFDGHRDLEWREVSGEGEVFSYTIARRGPPAFRGKEPYLIAMVTLDVGVNVIANMVHCGLDEIAIGMKVKPYWLPLSNGTHLLMFEPAR